LKIITGQYGGRRFDPPRNLSARPTTDLAKQALFNILQNRMDLEGCRALDLFSGTGSISFELLSRGAAHVVSVEMGHTQQQFIQKVAAQLNVPRNRHQLIRGDVFRYLNTPPAMSVGASEPSAASFDLIFADPPYDLAELDKLPNLVLQPGWLAPDGIFILEHGKASDFSSHPLFQELRTYGAVHFSFFQHPRP
jgi:16S rRNA (guanine(966)-N(2))-methyltransferase RsmD